MKTTPEQRVHLRASMNEARWLAIGDDVYLDATDVIDVLDDLDEALAEMTLLRAVAAAARATVRLNTNAPCAECGAAAGDMCLDMTFQVHGGRGRCFNALRAALRAWEEQS